MKINVCVSVIITTFNRKRELGEAINSILNQTWSDFELIIVDNYSNYDFFAFVDSFNDSRIKSFRNHNNGIIAVNRNYGIRHATGKYLAFCDDDDIWMSSKLEVQIKYLEEKRNINVLVHSNTILFGQDIKCLVTKKFNITKFDDFFKGNPISLSSVVIARSEYIFFDESLAKRTVEDFDLWLRLFLSGYEVVLLNEPLVRYRVSNNSALRNNLSMSYLKFILVIIDNIIKSNSRDFSRMKLYFLVNILVLKYIVRDFHKN